MRTLPTSCVLCPTAIHIFDAPVTFLDLAAISPMVPYQVRILPLSACIVVFWVIYTQMTSNYQLQGCQMDLNTLGLKLSPASLNVFDSMVIMLLVPLVDGCVYPLLHRFGLEPSMLTKIGLGFAFAMGSVIAAGFVETKRREPQPSPSSPPLPPPPPSPHHQPHALTLSPSPTLLTQAR